jgi:hypothetical protein
MAFSHASNAKTPARRAGAHPLKVSILAAALLPAAVHSAKETLHLQIGRNKSDVATDIEILDTVLLWVDYEKLPEVDPPQGGKWSALEKDSVWIDDGNQKNVRYTHNFLASMGSRKGYGFDYISFTSSGTSLPQYTAYASFHFRGDTTVKFGWDPAHYQDNPEVHPYSGGLRPGTGMYGEVSKHVGEGGANLAQGQWAKLLIRENGWTGGDGPTSLRPVKQAGRKEGWVVHLAPGTLLRAPAGAKGLKVLDVQGRLRWGMRNLEEGAVLAVPGDLPRGVLRIDWQSD